MIGIEPGKAVLFPYSDEYKTIANNTIKNLKNILGNLAVRIEHVGSTAIIGIKAKPIIDIAIGVKNFDDINSIKNTLEKNGFYFSKMKLNNSVMSYKCEIGTKRTHNIHIVIFKEERWQEFVLFRDYLNKYPKIAKKYEKLKEDLSRKYKNNIHKYTEQKSQFISNIIDKAKQEF